MSNSTPDKIKIFVYLAVAGVTVMFQSYRLIKKKTKIRNLAKQVITSASAGNIELEAVSWPYRNILNNMEGHKCIYRHMKIQKYVRRGKNGKWETVWSKQSEEPFLVFDYSGYVLVHPGDLDNSDIIENLIETNYTPSCLSISALESFQEFYDNSITGFSASSGGGFFAKLFGGHFRILERSIPIGCPLLIHGHYSPEDSARYIHLKDEFILFKQRASKLLAQKSYRQSMFDKNKDGEVDMKELSQG
ncbi:MAG: hypothetical protein K2Q18_01405, partial [Bdellovibrionales bacterium]|nr:hypothetical protein [Bdellovibrionales bacterium]